MHFIVSSLCAWHDLHSFSLKKKKNLVGNNEIPLLK